MTAAYVQSKVATTSGAGGTSAVFDAPPTATNLIIAVLTERGTPGSPRVGPSGFTKVGYVNNSGTEEITTLWYKVASVGQSSTVSVTGATNVRRMTIAEFSGVGALVDQESVTNQGDATSHPSGSVTIGTAGLLIGVSVCDDNAAPGGLNPTFTDDAAFTLIATGLVGVNTTPADIVAYRIPGAGSYGFTPTTDYGGRWGTILAAFEEATVFTADFSADVTSGVVPLTVHFTDESYGGTGAATVWSWDFGDTGTSTSQNPSHVYTSPGNYSVTLTATNPDGSDSETKTTFVTVTVDVGYTDPPPAGAILEIYASAPSAARWDVAKWDEDLWSASGWRDVTPYGITVEILWGSDRPEMGILSVPSAASWAIDYHDPDRILDPANIASPYYSDLIPGLPIRLSHRGVVVRQGYATGIGHSYRDPQSGYMRGADNITRMANADVPSDTELADTLYSRAVDAIAAAGLSIHVRPPRGANPAVSPWITGEREWTVWEWVKDAAQEVLYIPFIDRLGNLDFRPWADPLVRGRSVNDDELVDLTDIADYSGQYSVVRAREDDTTLVERALTPPPRYGARTFTRDEITIDSGGWADAVLADRGLPTLRWEPGTIRPLTARSLENIALIESVERISVALPDEDPALFVTGIVVGGEISVRGKYPDEAIWRFRLNLAGAANEPLIETDGEPTDYLLATGGGEYLYPSS